MKDQIRLNYEKEVNELVELGNSLKADGINIKIVAKTLCNFRRLIGIKYKYKRNIDYREKIFERNLKKYGDKLGPNFEYLENKYNGNYEKIINTSFRVNKDYEKLKKENKFENWNLKRTD